MTDCYPPRLGGIEVQVRDLAHRLAAAGHRVEVFTATVGADGARGGVTETQGDVVIHRMGMRLPGGVPMNPFAAPEIRRRLVGGGFDVAHVHMGIISPFTMDCTRLALSAGVPVSMTWHCMLGPAELPFQLSARFRRWADEGVAMNAVSAVAAAPVQRVIGDAGSVTVLPNGIDLDTWWRPNHPEHPPYPAPEDGRLRVITAMRLALRKRPIPMLAVMQRVRALLPGVDVRLTVLGEGRLHRAVDRYVRREGMADWVDLPGRVTREELMSRYVSSHVYLSPARLESFGIAALEARCVGLPVVGLHSSGAAEFVIDGVNGFLAEDDEGMALAIVRLLTDQSLRERMFAYNVSVAPAQGWPSVVATTVTEYERAAALVRPPVVALVR